MSYTIPSMKDLRDEVKKQVAIETRYLMRELEFHRKKCLKLEEEIKVK